MSFRLALKIKCQATAWKWKRRPWYFSQVKREKKNAECIIVAALDLPEGLSRAHGPLERMKPVRKELKKGSLFLTKYIFWYIHPDYTLHNLRDVAYQCVFYWVRILYIWFLWWPYRTCPAPLWWFHLTMGPELQLPFCLACGHQPEHLSRSLIQRQFQFPSFNSHMQFLDLGTLLSTVVFWVTPYSTVTESPVTSK